MILEINVGIQAVSLTDGAFSVIITKALHTFESDEQSCNSSSAHPLLSVGYYHANLE